MTVVVVPLHMQSIPTRNFVYMVHGERRRDAIIIDPVGDLDAVLADLHRRDLTLRGILVTHTHADHIGLVAPLLAGSDCPVWVSSREADRLDVPSHLLRVLDGGNSFELAGLQIEPIPTPGHTLCSLWHRIGENLFTGNTLFIEGCGTCSGPNSDPGLLFDSLLRLRDEIAPETRVYPGHRYVYPIGQPFSFVLEHNIYMQFDRAQRALFIGFKMRRG